MPFGLIEIKLSLIFIIHILSFIINKKILFLSYDGLTDPLGQSQILPYMTALSEQGFDISIISCEKPDKYSRDKAKIDAICLDSAIDWQPVMYQNLIPFISQAYTLYTVFQKAKQLHRVKKIDLVHARSYVVSIVALKLKQQFGIKFLFDTRGFWHEERLGHLRQHFLLKYIFHFFNNKEKQYFAQADGIVTLNETAKKEIETRADYQRKKAPIAVIPCCADYDLFRPATDIEKKKVRQKLGISEGVIVMGYVGSTSDKLYMLDEMLDFFKILYTRFDNACFIILTLDNQVFIKEKIKIKDISEAHVIIKSATRKEVAQYLKAIDFAISFILPLPEKRGCSPTKMGEYFAMNVPVVVNDGVGDVSKIVKNTEGGVVVKDFKNEDYVVAINAILSMQNQAKKVSIREQSKNYYDLYKGVQSYGALYCQLIG